MNDDVEKFNPGKENKGFNPDNFNTELAEDGVTVVPIMTSEKKEKMQNSTTVIPITREGEDGEDNSLSKTA